MLYTDPYLGRMQSVYIVVYGKYKDVEGLYNNQYTSGYAKKIAGLYTYVA